MSDPFDVPAYQPPPPLLWGKGPATEDMDRPPRLPSREPERRGMAPALKTLISMLISAAVYSLYLGWPFAVGFTLLLLVHELGHLVAARVYGLRVSAPVFLPFLGAFINLKEPPPNAWVEAVVGIAGPLFGTMAASVPYFLFVHTGEPFWGLLANWGFFLNLFNLAPVGSLDGGRIATAVSRWLWIPGYVVLLSLLASRWAGGQNLNHFLGANFVLLAILVLGLPRLFSLFRPRSEAEQRYFAVRLSQRWLMGGLYFGLIALLYLGMRLTRVEL